MIRNQISNIFGHRVIKDHDRDGIYKLWEMENPLNRSMIDYNINTKIFSVVDPSKVDWSIYFDTNIFPNVVDQITDWGELHTFWPDSVKLEGREVITFTKDIYDQNGNVRENITFADYYNYLIPSIEELRWAGKAGNPNWEYSTDDGTITTENTVFNGGWDKIEGKHKGASSSCCISRLKTQSLWCL